MRYLPPEMFLSSLKLMSRLRFGLSSVINSSVVGPAELRDPASDFLLSLILAAMFLF
jgi:hypothetical protein